MPHKILIVVTSLTEVVPFLIEPTFKAQGGHYERAAVWQSTSCATAG